MNSRWLWRGVTITVLMCGLFAAAYGWYYVDWYDFFPVVPPVNTGDVVQDPYSELLDVRINEIDPRQQELKVKAGEYFSFTGKARLDPQHFCVNNSFAGAEIAKITSSKASLQKHLKEQKMPRFLITGLFVGKSWLNGGEKKHYFLRGTTGYLGKNEVDWEGRARLYRPGRYLVRLIVADRFIPQKSNEPLRPPQNERTVATFYIIVE